MIERYYHIFWAAALAGGFILCKFTYEKKILGLIQNKLPAIFIAALVLGIVILAFCNKLAGRNAFGKIIANNTTSISNRLSGRRLFDRVTGRKTSCISFSPFSNKFTAKIVHKTSFSPVSNRYTAETNPDLSLTPDKNILLKVALLYPIVIFFVCGFFSSSIFFMSTDKQVLNLLWQNAGPVENLEINVLGRISSHVNNKNGTSYFSLATAKLLLKDLSSGVEQTINAKDEVFVRIRTNDRYFLKRDDLISFNCRVFSKGGYMSLTAYQDNVVKIDSNANSTSKNSASTTDNDSENTANNDSADMTNNDSGSAANNDSADMTNNASASAASTINTLSINNLVGTHSLLNVTQKIYNIRSRFYKCIRNTFYNNLEYNSAALCEAIILGNTNNIPEKTITDFRKSGIYHLIAISGLHITFFIFMVTAILNFILKPSNAAGKGPGVLRIVTFIFIILTLFLYNFIAGEKASALRATVMSVFIITANLMERQYSKKIILSISFVILLTLNPEFFYNWGFWLSFSSMAAILYLNPVITDLFKFIRKRVQESGSHVFGSYPDADDPDSAYRRSKRRLHGENYFVSSIITTVSVNIFIFPVLIFLFQELPVFSIPANLLASPVFYLLLAILLTASFLSLLWPPLGGFVLEPAGLVVEVLLKIARIYKISDYNVISLSSLKAYHLVIYYFALAAIFIALSQWLDRKKVRCRKS